MGCLREHAASQEARFAQKMEECSAALKAKEKEVLDLQATLTDAKEWNLREEERNHQREQELLAENKELRSQRTEFKELADEFMLKWKIVNEQKDQQTDSYHALQEEGIVTREKLWAEWTKEVEEATTQLTKHYEQTIALVTAIAKNNQASWELLIAKYQAEAEKAKEELEANRAHPGTSPKRLSSHSVAQAKNEEPKLTSYTSYAPTPRTDGRRAEDFTRWTKPVSRTSART